MPTSALPTPLHLFATPGTQAQSSEQRAWALEALQGEMRACCRCVAAGYLPRADSVAGFRGRVTDQVMVIGQAPGHLSIARGLPFSGPGGKILQSWLVRAGFAPEDFRQRIYISALTRCDPGRNARGGGDRKPSPPEVALCRPFLLRELELVRPRIILLIGGMAIEAFLGPRRLEEIVGTGVEQNGVRLLPLPHPSGVSRWLNLAAHQRLLAQALEVLATWRVQLGGAAVHGMNTMATARAASALASSDDGSRAVETSGT